MKSVKKKYPTQLEKLVETDQLFVQKKGEKMLQEAELLRKAPKNKKK